MDDMVITSRSGLQMDPFFALALLHKFYPTLTWVPPNSLCAAENAFFQKFSQYPDYCRMATDPTFRPLEVQTC